MRLTRLAEGFEIRAATDPDLTGISEDSRRIGAGMLFVAVPGASQDGHAYVADAVARGAAAVVAERPPDLPVTVPFVRVESARRALAVLAARFYGAPADALQIIGFTGTFGKTSTSEILRTLLEAGGSRTGVVGSLGARYGAFHDPGNGLTTPAPVELHRALRGLSDAGAGTAIMEVTSHALRMERVRGLSFGGGLIAAIMPGEHTDFHRSYDDYVAAKRLFLDYLAPDAVLAFDADNRPSASLAAEARVAVRAGVSLEGSDASVQLRDIELDRTGAVFVCHADGDGLAGRTGHRMHSPLLGPGHLRNVALAIAYAAAAGVPREAIAAALPELRPLRRRMEHYEVSGRSVLDDSAAHPDSFRATFEVAAMLAAGRAASGGTCRVVLVYAIRGNRGADINKRNAGALAELVIRHRIETVVVTAALDATGQADRATAEEIDVTRDAFHPLGAAVAWHDTLRAAVRGAAMQTRAGDLIVLIGAQGMNEGKRLLLEG